MNNNRLSFGVLSPHWHNGLATSLCLFLSDSFIDLDKNRLVSPRLNLLFDMRLLIPIEGNRKLNATTTKHTRRHECGIVFMFMEIRILVFIQRLQSMLNTFGIRHKQIPAKISWTLDDDDDVPCASNVMHFCWRNGFDNVIKCVHFARDYSRSALSLSLLCLSFFVLGCTV